MARRRRRRPTLADQLFGKLIFWLIVLALGALLLGAVFKFWYVSFPLLAVIGGFFYWRRQNRRKQAERAEREWDAQLEANRKAWREITWDEGPYSVIVSGFGEPSNADAVWELLSDTPRFRDHPHPDEAADEVIERIEHIAPQPVAEGIAQHNAIHLKQALESRGAKVKITETVRVRPSSAGPREPISASVRREVWRRDGGKCVDCGSRERLEYDHIIAVANGGSNTARNIERNL